MKKFYFLFSALFFTAICFAQQPVLPVDFESATINYTFTDFAGGGTTKILNPQISGINTSANVAQMIKSNGEVYGGSLISLAAPIDFSVNKIFKIKVYSPRVGARLLLKVENETNASINFEREATTTLANTWEELSFNYSSISTTNQYQKLIFIFDNGTFGDGSANFTFLFDDISLVTSGGSGLTQMNTPVTFDDATVDYGLVGFGGAEQSTVVTDPTLATNKVAKVIKTATAETYAGTTITAPAELGFSSPIPFTASSTKMNVRVWSPDAGIQVRLKVEVHGVPTQSVETEATVTVAAGWQTLEFNFANQSAGTAALNLAFPYDKATIFFNFGVAGSAVGEKTYYFDDVKFGGAIVSLTQMNLPVTFDDVTVDYGFIGFAGAEQSTIVTDPTLATNKVAKVIKTATAETYAGTTITAPAELGFSSPIPFTASSTKMNVRVWSPDAGIQVRLKVEVHAVPTQSVETEATVTVAAGWQTLEFNFANQSAGTAALNLAFPYDKATIFFNFGVAGSAVGEKTYYFDDVKFGGAIVSLTQMNLPVTFDDVTVDYGFIGFAGAEQSTIVTDPTLATNKVAKVIKTATAETYAGTTITAPAELGFSSPIPFTASSTKMNVRVWSPDAGIQVRLKVEVHAVPTQSVETESTVTVAAGWQTLEFNFANQSAGTAALNLAFPYDKATIFFNFGVAGSAVGEKTYYFDDVKFGGAIVSLTQMNLPVTFDDVTVDYGFIGFAGAEQSTIVTDPTLATNKVAKVIKTATAETYAGTTITAPAELGFSSPIPFTASSTKMNVRVWSPDAGIQVRLKVEVHAVPTQSVETESTVTVAAGWQTLEFNFANQSAGTAALNLAFPYDKATIFFNFGVAGSAVGEKTYYFDDVKFGGAIVSLTQMNLPVTFDDVTVDYGFIGFAGAEQSTIVTDPTLATNKVAKVIKTATAETYAGTTITAPAELGFSSPIPFTASSTKMNVRVWSPDAGIQVRLKVEVHAVPTQSVETESTVTVAAGWQTLEFNFANQSAGTAALNLAFPYDKATIFFNFGVAGSAVGEKTYYFDDVKFGGAIVSLTQMNLPVTFDDVTVDYGFIGFAGAEQSTIVTDPTLATNKVAKVIKTATAETYAGTTITAPAELGFSSPIPFTASSTKMNVRVWSPDAGIQVRLKVEVHAVPTQSVETEATVTVAAGWQTLEFNFANQSAGTAALNLAFPYDKATIFFNFGVAGSAVGEKTYYFDDIKFGAAVVSLTQMNLPVTFDDAAVDYGLIGFGGAEQSTVVTDPTLATNKVAKVIKTATAEVWAGTTVTAPAELGFSSPIPFTASSTKMNVRVWSPDAGIQVRLKVEVHAVPSQSVETEATVTVAAGWQTLEFNFANQAAGTAALNLAFPYDKASIFFNFGVAGSAVGEKTYYFDDVKFGGAIVSLTQMNLPITFDDVTVDYGFIGFAGAEQSTIVTDPTLATNKVAKVIKTATAETYAGTTITAPAELGFSSPIPFTASSTKMNVRVWSPDAGIQVRLKVEVHAVPTQSVETEATVTVAAGWQTLEFNFANQVTGTSALNLAFPYDKATIFFNFGVAGSAVGEKTYYFDDVNFGGLPGPVLPPAPSVSPAISYCQFATAVSLTATALPGNTLLWYTVSTGGTSSTTAPIPSTTTIGITNYYVSQVDAIGLEGPRALTAVTIIASPSAPDVISSLSYCQNVTPSRLTATPVPGNSLNWYTSLVGGTASTVAPAVSTTTVGSTSYYVSQSNATGCESQRATITVTILAIPATPVISAPFTGLFPGLTTTISGASGSANAYSWLRNELLVSGETGNSINVNVDGLGDYNLLVTNAAGCSSLSNTISISDSINARIFVYPNPSTGIFQVRFISDANNLNPRRIVIFDSKGAMVYNAGYVMFNAYTPMQVDLSKCSAGIYYIKLLDNNGKRISSSEVLIYR